MYNILSLFSGTNSWTQFYPKDKYNIISVDREYRYNPTLVRDVAEWNYKAKRDIDCRIDVIYASPPCNMYFTFMKNPPGINPKMRQNEYTAWEQQQSILLVSKTIEIIEYFKPKFYVIENPVGRIIRHFPVIFARQPIRVDYCMYGFNYRKPTYIYTNVEFEPKLCIHKKHDFKLKNINKGILGETNRAMIASELSKEMCGLIANQLIA